MEKIFVELDDEKFVIHLKKDGAYLNGGVYSILEWKKPDTNEKGWSYQNNQNGSTTDTIENARCFFGFIFCWRGVWEGRIYFKDDEYWSEELETISNLWSKIEALLKERIKKENPDNEYDD